MINWPTIIVSIISFLLGLFGNLFVQWWADRKRLNRIKGALKLHLGDLISKECKTLKSEFERIIVNIEDLNRNPIAFKSCKTFDAEIYKANNPSDYYKIYGKDNNKFDKLVSTYAIISFLKDNMPFKIYTNYLMEVNEHLYEPVVGISVNQTFNESSFFIEIRINYIAICNDLINEVDMLSKLIEEFIK